MPRRVPARLWLAEELFRFLSVHCAVPGDTVLRVHCLLLKKIMERWKGKVAVVTGASSGIGLETAKMLKENGVDVVGVARSVDKMMENMKNASGTGKFFIRECDITNEYQVQETFKWIERQLGSINILVNSAGRAKQATIADISSEDMARILDVNVMGLLHCTRCALKLMKKDEKQESHIININSTAGQKVPFIQGVPLNVYPATKFAVTALCQSLISELKNTKIKVSSISPGVVSTNFYFVADLDSSYISMQPRIYPEDVANSILHVLSAPQHVQITELTIVPVGQVI